MRFLILPGYGDSGPTHWQTHWQADLGAARFRPSAWEGGVDLADWLSALDRALELSDEPAVLVAHSLACLLIARWAARKPSARAVAGAFLVAAPDPTSAVFPADALGFAPYPRARLPFPSVLVTSTDDPYASPSFSAELAHTLGAPHVVAGAFHHLGGASGVGAWPQGRSLFAAFCAGLPRSGGQGEGVGGVPERAST